MMTTTLKRAQVFLYLLTISYFADALNTSKLYRVIADDDLMSQEQCDGVIYRGTYYDKYRLFQGIWKPTNLLLHQSSGILFISHTITNATAFDSSIMSCHMKSKNCLDILAVPGGRAIAFDHWNSLIYFGGSDGIYTYNVQKNELKFFGEKGKAIWGIGIGRNFFYIDYPTKQLYSLSHGKFHIVSKVEGIEVDVFYVSKKFNVYFYNKSGLYVVDVETKMSNILNDSIVVTQIIEDINGDIFFSAQDGVYVYFVGTGIFSKIADIKNVYGIAFAELVTSKGTSYQLIYSDEYSINILFPSNHEEKCKSGSNLEDANVTPPHDYLMI